MFGSSKKKKAKKAAAQAQANNLWMELSRTVNGPRPQALADLEIEGAKEYNEKITAYNSRLDEVTRQMKGQSINEKIAPLKQTYTSQIAAQLDAQDARNANNPFSNMGRMSNNIGIMSGQKPQTNEQKASSILEGRGGFSNNISDIINRISSTNSITQAYQKEVAKYSGVNSNYRNLSNLQAIFDDVNTLGKAINLTGQKNKIQEQVEFKGSKSGQTLAAQKKSAMKRGRASTILTGNRG